MRLTLFVCAITLAACSGSTSEPQESIVDLLQDATFTGILDEPIVLTGGRYEGEPFMDDSASRPVVTLVPDVLATGDLAGDDTDEAAVVLAHNAGGSGTFLYLAVVKQEDGGPDNIATISLGDRVRVAAIRITNGRIVADLLEHAPRDPMCCPTTQLRREWLFEKGELVPVTRQGGLQVSRFRGHLVWGHESRTFTSCDEGREGWVINESGDELVEIYEELTTAPYQPMFAEVRGEWDEAPADGFGADFSEALRIVELVRAENEGFGCRLELDGLLFVASGNEPSWRLQVRETGVVLRSMDAPGAVEFPAMQKSGQPPHIDIEAQGPDSVIRISLERRRCVDSMSGARYAWAASVELDGLQLEGCAAEGI